ncbi:MAG: GNAT family N-acetyltransferase [bacterium]|nr:GNAT family N-acetyltransferase [bacterium]
MSILNLNKQNIPEITEVLCEAFHNYPVMKYVIGQRKDYDKRLRKLVTFFVSARALRNEPLLGIYNSENKLVAAAAVTLAGEIPSPPELFKLRDELWREIGSEEKSRYEKYGSVASGLLPKEPHHHLNMIGVRNAYQGKGLARQLINKVEELVSAHPTSTGLSLNTEVEVNVNFYLHLGFELLGKAIVDEGIITWGFFKKKI